MEHPRPPAKVKAKVSRFLPTRSVIANLILIGAGSAISAVGINSILVPGGFLSGGAVGLALIIHYLVPSLGVGLLYFAINIPMLLLGWVSVGRRFMGYTLVGIAVFSAATQWIHLPPPVIENRLLSAILAGLIVGLGNGIIFRSAGSAGGVDILAAFLNKKWNIRLGWTLSGFNVLVLSVAAWVFSLEAALYALIFSFTAAKVIDAVITGFNTRKQVFIITDKADLVARRIMTRLRRGATFLDGQGAYTGRPKKVVLTIVTLTELGRVKDLIYATDPHAFVVINDTLEVVGTRHGAWRVY